MAYNKKQLFFWLISLQVGRGDSISGCNVAALGQVQLCSECLIPGFILKGPKTAGACPSQDDHTNQREPEKYTMSFKALSQNPVHCHFCPYSIVQCKSPGEARYQWDRVTYLTYSHRKCKITWQRTCIFLTQGRPEELEQ